MPACAAPSAAAILLLLSLGNTPAGADPAPAPTPWRDCSDCPEMVTLPAGRYTMGSNATEQARFGVTPDYAATELPAHEVHIERPFALGRTVVTRDEWARYVSTVSATADADAPGCAVLTPATGSWAVDPKRSWRDPGFVQRGNEPAVCINWNEARAYVAWLSARTGQRYRLPTEAEWEYAARASTTTANYWGDGRDSACAHANASDLDRAERHGFVPTANDSAFLCHDGYVHTAPVDAFPPNAWGLYGMSGNVWQWVEDCHDSSYAGAPADGSAHTDGDCQYHVNRGASWVNSPRFVRAAARHKDLTQARTSVLGLRLARDL